MVEFNKLCDEKTTNELTLRLGVSPGHVGKRENPINWVEMRRADSEEHEVRRVVSQRQRQNSAYGSDDDALENGPDKGRRLRLRN